ncbi:hypothetical protein AgCh_030454 [Apium graveolens]
MSLQETTWTLLQESMLPRTVWAKAVNTTSYVLNIVLIRPLLNKTPYELRKKKPNIGYCNIFGHAYRVYNIYKNVVKESIDVSFQESNDDLSREEEDVAGTGTGSELAVKNTDSQSSLVDFEESGGGGLSPGKLRSLLMGVEKLRKQGRPQEDEEMDFSFDLRSQDFEIHDNENPVDSKVAKLFPSSKATAVVGHPVIDPVCGEKVNTSGFG